jgi:phospholipase C
MKPARLRSTILGALRTGLGSLALLQLAVGPAMAQATAGGTATPIKHVIVIIGENHSFDNVFATYIPQTGTIWNLLSEGIVNRDGSPGLNFSRAQQRAAYDMGSDAFLLDPSKTSFPNNVLPAPLVGGPSDSYIPGDSLALAQSS